MISADDALKSSSLPNHKTTRTRGIQAKGENLKFFHQVPHAGYAEIGETVRILYYRESRAIQLLKVSHVDTNRVRTSLQLHSLNKTEEYYAVSRIWASAKHVYNLDISKDKDELGGYIPITKSCQNVLNAPPPRVELSHDTSGYRPHVTATTI